MVNWFRKLRRIVAGYDSDQRRLLERVSRAEGYIRDKTEVSADVSCSGRDPHQIIMVGRYKNRDYVEVFSMSGEDFAGFVERLREMRRYAEVRRIDCAPHMRAFIDV